jgi:hypothetical protein
MVSLRTFGWKKIKLCSPLESIKSGGFAEEWVLHARIHSPLLFSFLAFWATGVFKVFKVAS